MNRANGRQQLEAVCLPAEAFAAALADIDHLGELKLCLHCLALLQQKEGRYCYLRHAELQEDTILLQALGSSKALEDALRKATKRGSLLEAQITLDGQRRRLFTWNDEAGRDWQARILAGEWQLDPAQEIQTLPPRPSLYQLYEENIGVMTPMMAQSIGDAANEYPHEWIEEAMRYAVERNARSWRYIIKVLAGWRQEGRSHEETGRNPEGRRRYTDGKWKKFIQS